MAALPMAHPSRALPLRWLLALCVAALALVAAPARAADPQRVDSVPEVGTFQTARFDILSRFTLGGEEQVFFGEGQVINPDRLALWVGTNGTGQLDYFVQIGSVVYVNEGSGWERQENVPVNGSLFPIIQPVTMNDGLNQLEEVASGILRVGEAPVRGVPTTHYQVWVSGVDAFDDELVEPLSEEDRDLLRGVVLKVDLWIGQDSLIYQQNIELTLPPINGDDITLPSTTYTSLITYYDINDPNIVINPPI